MEISSPEEFDRIFDDGAEDIVEYVDWSTAYRTRDRRQFVSVALRDDVLACVEGEAQREGLDRDTLIESWLVDRLRERVP
jgi:hypothetical protein